jgi:hypothetical protein
MWEWYRIGVAAGLGAALGLLCTGLAGATTTALAIATFVAAAAATGVGLALDNWNEAVGGAVGGVLGVAGAVQLVRGALRRGGTRGGTGVLVGVAGLGIAALALVPFVGYLEALALPALGARLQRRGGGRYAGLRILARD